MSLFFAGHPLLQKAAAFCKKGIEWTKDALALELGNVQVFHCGLNILVSQKVFQCHNIHTVFEQMRGVTVPKRVGMNFFDNTRCLGHLLDRPLHASLRIPIVKIAPAPLGKGWPLKT
ncbi:hypothetical protein [Flavobacterium sp. DSP2-3-1]|uniref:hypothetical protein n=1 Tax=Flavobacterium sp. DSP2-3-1 TaxID=2804620 RepID=UPI003CF517F1